jgi:hypothetical protein
MVGDTGERKIPMPLHDWSGQPAGSFHAFHNSWIADLQKALNRGLLPPGFMALGEQLAGEIGPDILTLRTQESTDRPVTGGILLAERPPKAKHRYEASSDAAWYAAKQRSVVIRHVTDQTIVAVIEIVSPGNKHSRGAVQTFIEKLSAVLARGIHALMIDPFRPGNRDPDGLHALLWEQISGEALTAEEHEPLVASYQATQPIIAFVEPVPFGTALPEMPLFLTSEVYVNVPLEATYQSAWEGMPAEIQRQLTANSM